MDETLNVQTVTDIPENTLINEPEYTLKKKFNFASIPYLFSFLLSIFGVVSCIGMLVNYITDYDSPAHWFSKSYLFSSVSGIILNSFDAVVLCFLCILLFAKVYRPILSVPFFALAFSTCISLATTEISCLINIDWDIVALAEICIENKPFLFLLVAQFSSLIFAIPGKLFLGVYIIISTSKKARSDISKKRRWYLPVIALAVFGFVSCVSGILMEFAENQIMKFPDESLFVPVFLNIISYLYSLVGPLLLCLWISNPYKKVQEEVPEAEITEEETNGGTEEKTEVEEDKNSEPEEEKAVSPMPFELVMPEPAPMQGSAVNSDIALQKENIELIKKYKELLDMGAISQEDYEKKKNKLLDS